MIPEISRRLDAWAYWSLAKSSGGFPRMSTFARLTPRSSGHAGFGNIDQDSWEVEQAIQALPARFKEAVLTYYLGRGTIAQKARDCGCCAKTLTSRLDAAHEKIQETLNFNRRKTQNRTSNRESRGIAARPFESAEPIDRMHELQGCRNTTLLHREW